MIQYLRSHVLPSKPMQLLIRTGIKWQQDDCASMAAALSYYALFSLFPMLLIVLSLIGGWIGPGTEAFNQIQVTIAQFLPPEVRDIVKGTVIALSENRTGAGIIGFSLLLYSASTVFAVLNNSVQKIWQVNQPSASIRQTVSSFILNKLLAFLLVLGTAFILLASLLLNLAIQAILGLVNTFQATFAWIRIDELEVANGLQFGSSLLMLAIVACLLFKILPATYVAWKDVWLGALLSAFLLVGLQRLVSNSVISIGSQFLSYGIVGGVMILLLWLYLTCHIFFIGCEFSYIYAHLFGSRRRAPERLGSQG